MLSSLARSAVARPKRLLAFAGLAFAACGAFGGPAAGMLNAHNPFSDPSSQSARAEQLLRRATGTETEPGVLALVPAGPANPEVAGVAARVRGVSGVAAVSAPAPGMPSPLVSSSGGSSMVAATLFAKPNPDQVVSRIERALAGLEGVRLGGSDVAGVQIGKQALADLGFAEALAFPLLAIIALLVFRGVAAVLPLATGGLAVLAAFLVLRLVNMALPLSVFALNLVIAVGLGLAVDYSLFIAWRFREELRAGREVPEALERTLSTAGRTVVFSAVTVAAAMAALTVFPLRFLVSMGIGGAAVALVAAASALLVLPPLLVLMAAPLARARVPQSGTGRWYQLAQAVMKRPLLVATATASVLLMLASPAPRVHWSGIDATVLPTSRSARVVQDVVDRDFPALNGGQALLVVAKGRASERPQLQSYDSRLSAVPGIASAEPPTMVSPDVWLIRLGTPYSGISTAGQRTAEAVRAVAAPAPVLVGGPASDTLDLRHSIARATPLALLILALVTMIVLWLMTGSVVLPFKTFLMNALTAAAATGILVLVFQDGRFTTLLSYTSQGGIEETDFLILVAVAFALSTDYGVFLLARIQESRASARDERQAVAMGLERTGRLVTAASIMLAVAIGAFSTSKVVFLKEVGVGTAAAVLLDAFVVRALLVPSLMALLGRWNWWSPSALRRLHSRLELSD